MALIGGVWLFIGAWDLFKSEFLPEEYQGWTVVRLTPHMHWRTWLIVGLTILIIVLLEGAHSAIEKRNAQLERHRPVEPPPNLQINWDGVIYGTLYLSDDGIWSASAAPEWSDAAKFGFLSFRIKVTNPHVEGRKVGPALAVSGQVEFTYDTGLSGWSASPAAWVHDPRAKVTVDVDHEKELILAVGKGEKVMGMREWSVISNVRREDGSPMDKTAMLFRDAPWNCGKFRVSIVRDGEAQTMDYEWLDADTGVPKIRPIMQPSRSESSVRR